MGRGVGWGGDVGIGCFTDTLLCSGCCDVLPRSPLQDVVLIVPASEC